jgi:hypothetical protein
MGLAALQFYVRNAKLLQIAAGYTNQLPILITRLACPE